MHCKTPAESRWQRSIQLAPIRARRQDLGRQPEQILRMLEEGTERGRAVARATVSEARRAMHLDYQMTR